MNDVVNENRGNVGRWLRRNDLLPPDMLNAFSAVVFPELLDLKEDAVVLLDGEQNRESTTSENQSTEWLCLVRREATVELRRLTKNGKNRRWRHFPMEPPGAGQLHDQEETDGVDLGMDLELESIPTWRCSALWALGAKDGIQNMMKCLACLARFPTLAGLSPEAASLQRCLNVPYCRSYELIASIHNAIAALRAAGVNEDDHEVFGDINPRIPSLDDLKRISQLLWTTVQNTPVDIPTGCTWDRFLEQFETFKTSFTQGVLTPNGADWTDSNLWTGKKTVQLTPQPWFSVENQHNE